MRYLRPTPRRLLPDDMLVWAPDGAGGFAATKMIRHVRFEREESVVDDPHRSADGGHGTVFVDAVNSAGTFEVPAGSRVLASRLWARYLSAFLNHY
jgi:hypothetical protein